MFASRVGLLALLLATVATVVTCEGLSALAALGLPAGGLGKGPAAADAFGMGAGGPSGLFGDLVGKKYEGDKKKEGEGSTVAPTKPSTGVTQKSEGFLGVKGPFELGELALNPFELCAKIAEYFKLPFNHFFKAISKGVNFGFELAVQPLVLSLKIIEKVFVPDSCKLKVVCNLARTFAFSRGMMPKLSDKVLNESKMFKAMSDGIHGDCEAIYQCNGHAKIKDEYKDHHEAGHKHGEHKNDEHKYKHGDGHHGEEHKHNEHKNEDHKYKHGDGHHGEEHHGEAHHEGHHEAHNEES